MPLDLEHLLRSHGDDAPSGENLEYDSGYQELEIAARPGERRQVGDSVIEGEEPDWKDVQSRALAILDRSHDLRAAMFLANASLHLKGLPGFAESLSYIRACLEQRWDTCHPELDADDDNDPTMRVNTIRALVDRDGILRALRNAPVTESRGFGRMSLREIEVADGEAEPRDGESAPDAASIGAAFQDTAEEKLAEILSATRAALADVKAIAAIFDDQTPGMGPDLSPLEKMLHKIAKRVAEYAPGDDDGSDDDDDDDEDDDDAPAPAPRAARPSAGGSGAVNSRQDVIAAIDRIVAYYTANEPSSPLPLLLLRARRLVNADFMTIMKDMAPSGVENVELIGGLSQDSDDDDEYS